MPRWVVFSDGDGVAVSIYWENIHLMKDFIALSMRRCGILRDFAVIEHVAGTRSVTAMMMHAAVHSLRW